MFIESKLTTIINNKLKWLGNLIDNEEKLEIKRELEIKLELKFHYTKLRKSTTCEM